MKDMSDKNINRAYLVLGIFGMAVVICLLAGCTPLAELDAKLWGTEPHVYANVDSQGQPILDAQGKQTYTTIPATPGMAPPIIELVAGALALFGYGGLGLWIHRSRKTINGQLNEASISVEELGTRVETLERNLKL